MAKYRGNFKFLYINLEELDVSPKVEKYAQGARLCTKKDSYARIDEKRRVFDEDKRKEEMLNESIKEVSKLKKIPMSIYISEQCKKGKSIIK